MFLSRILQLLLAGMMGAAALASAQDGAAVATFWVRAIGAPAGQGLASFVVEQGWSPKPKSILFAAAAQPDGKKSGAPFTNAQRYAEGGYDFGFRVTYPHQGIEIGPWPAPGSERTGPYRAGDMIRDFGAGAHRRSSEAMIHQDWTTRPAYVTSNGRSAYAISGQAEAGSITAAGVVNGASFKGGTVAPGEIVTIFGTGFGPAKIAPAAYGADGRLPTTASGTRVLFDGVAAPMLYSAAGQVAAIVPYSVMGTTRVQVEYLGVASNSVALPVAAAAPGIFMCLNKPDVAVVVNYSAGGKISCNDDYVTPGPGSIVSFFVTGEGAVTPPIAEGLAPSGGVFPAPATPWSVSFGEVPAQNCAATFIGLVYAGVTQVNVCVPDGVPRAARVPLTIAVGGISSAGGGVDLGPSWQLIWNDEFDGPEGASVDLTKWAFDLGGGGWGNQELETYTNTTENVFQDGNGNLVIRAVKSPTGQYTSGRIKTQGTFEFLYGKAEARIRIPFGQGLWPAFWMLGNDIEQAGWPACGEIDIMENIGREPAVVHGTVHGPGYSGGNGIGGPLSLADGRFSDGYHVYGVEWSPESVGFFVDGVRYFEVTPSNLPPGTKWVLDHPFFLLLNVAVGGLWPGNPDTTTTFPQEMLVDWVRVSQRGSAASGQP